MHTVEKANLIPITKFSTCLIDGISKNEIMKLYPGRRNGAYYLDKFSNHLLFTHKITIKEYCKNYLHIEWPKCPVRDKEVGYKIDGTGITLRMFMHGAISKEHSPAFKKACEKFSLERRGENNPMYGKHSWNFGKDKRNPIVKKMAESHIGFKFSHETKLKQSISAKKRKIHGHTGKKHSAKTRKILRENTARLWATGVFNRTTSIHIKMREFLKTLPLKESFKEECQVKYFSMDFAFENHKIAIECQGQYFHVDPRRYPDGPIDAIQRRNFGRDKAKKKICSDEGWEIIPIWEKEINNGEFKKQVVVALKRAKILDELYVLSES